jgi:3-phenylpropionate/cinnamic acid dioxygenase small subunit
MNADVERAAKQDITEVLVRYSTGIDSRDWDLFRTCFTEEVLAEYDGIATWHGVDEITDSMTTSHADMGLTMHQLANVAITVDGDTATARCYVDAVLMAADGQTGLNPRGFYDDQLIHTDDGWRIQHRRYTMVHLGTIGI